ncbi:unnamed protein product [Aphis gossypii]|uniref:Uncharacterized protein n=1 Tax=Aphis gossypii TaxID=80765 RepID=A0A9P0NLE1_APHGO|nr:unnamed protein product [Aphis gossypii]
MDSERNTDDAGKADGDTIVTPESSLSVMLHFTFDKPLATVYPRSGEEDGPTGEPEPERRQEQSEPADATVNISVGPSSMEVDKPSAAAAGEGTGIRRRRRRKSRRVRWVRNRSQRNQNSDDRQSQSDSDMSVIVEIDEKVSAGDHSRGGRKTTAKCLPSSWAGRLRSRNINRRRKSQYRRKK